MRRLRGRSKTPLALAAILATPLFFVALMALSLALEKPTMEHGRLADPSGANETAIWLLALVPSALVVLIGVGAVLVRRLGAVLSALGAITATVVLLVPLDGWADRHTARYPDGVDLIPKGDTSDLLLRGEWEDSARRAAEQIGHWTIAISVAAILLSLGLASRRGRRAPTPPPPPAIVGLPPGGIG